MSKGEKESLVESKLEFSVFCSAAGSLSVLKVYLNDDLLSSESIACESVDKEIILQESDLNIGKNEVTFVIDDGTYLLTPIMVKNKLNEEIYPSYTFNIDEDVYDAADNYFFSLQMGRGNKKAKLLLNNNNIELDTEGSYFQKDITNYIERGNNFLEIVPEEDFNVNSIKVWYE